MRRATVVTTIALVGALALPGVASSQAGQDMEGTITLQEESPFIAFNIWVKAGSQNDPQGKEGLAALTAAMLSDGSTKQDSYEAILEKLYPMAAGYGATVDKEMTTFTGRVHRDNLEGYYTLFRNALLEPAFAQEDFDRIKSQTLNYLERGRRYNRDEELSKELLFAMAYEGTPYAHPEEGYVQSVKSITLDDVKDFYADALPAQRGGSGAGGRLPGRVRAEGARGLRRAAGRRAGRGGGAAAEDAGRREGAARREGDGRHAHLHGLPAGCAAGRAGLLPR